MASLARFLKEELDKRVTIATRRISDEFYNRLTSTNWASRHGDLAKQGDLAPLTPGGDYKGRGSSIPAVMREEANTAKGSNISKFGTTTFIGFGNIPFLVSKSPQILWYEFGYSQGGSSEGDKGLPYIPGWFEVSQKGGGAGQLVWVAQPGIGRQGDGALFPIGHGFVRLAKAQGVDVQPSGDIPAVGMYRRTLIGLLPRLPQLIRGI